MIVNFHDYERSDIKSWSIVNAVTATGIVKTTNTEKIDIILSVDGVEIDFLMFMERIEESLEHGIKAEAKTLVGEMMGNMYDQVNDLDQYLTAKVDDIVDWE